MSDTTPRINFLSIACPAYNEAAGIVSVLEDWVAFARRAGFPEFEIVVCNDGSKDDTGKLLDELAARIAEIKPVHHAVNRGAAAALMTAIQETRGDWVLLTDSDGQFPIEAVDSLWAAIVRENADAAIGIRRAKSDTAFARFGSYASSMVCNLIYGRRVADFNSVFKLIRGEMIRSLSIESTGLNSSTEVTGKLLEFGDSVVLAQAPVGHSARATGRSSRTLFRASLHRFLFVFYLATRRILLKAGVLAVPSRASHRSREKQ